MNFIWCVQFAVFYVVVAQMMMLEYGAGSPRLTYYSEIVIRFMVAQMLHNEFHLVRAIRSVLCCCGTDDDA
jgi:hypothetical protein